MGSFGDRVRTFREGLELNQKSFAEKLGLKQGYLSAVETGKNGFSQEILTSLANLGADLNYLLTGKGQFLTPAGREKVGEMVLVPLYPQKIAAGAGQDWVDVEPVGHVPALKSFVHPWKPEDVKAVEVSGDSMTGINLFDGDVCFFKPGLIKDAGVYVISHGGRLRVKRLEFQKDKVLIHSENVRYSSEMEPAESQDLTILGKVLGWYHRHPY